MGRVAATADREQPFLATFSARSSFVSARAVVAQAQPGLPSVALLKTRRIVHLDYKSHLHVLKF
jgi:hypothetical protein